METTTKPVATWTPGGGHSLYGDLPTGDLTDSEGRPIAVTITLESAQRLYPEYEVLDEVQA